MSLAITAPPRVPIYETDEKGIPTGDMNYNWRRWFMELVGLQTRRSSFTVTINPSTIPAQNTVEMGFTVTGLKPGRDMVTAVVKPTHTAGIIAGNARVSGLDTLAIQFANVTISPIDPPEEEYLVEIRRI